MKKIYKNFTIISSALMFLVSCQVFIEPMPKSWKWGAKPRPLTGVRGLPSTDTSYGQGFKDGCGSAWDVVSKGLLSDLNDKRIDPKRLANDPDYSAGWADAIEHCTYLLDWETT